LGDRTIIGDCSPRWTPLVSRLSQNRETKKKGIWILNQYTKYSKCKIIIYFGTFRCCLQWTRSRTGIIRLYIPHLADTPLRHKDQW